MMNDYAYTPAPRGLTGAAPRASMLMRRPLLSNTYHGYPSSRRRLAARRRWGRSFPTLPTPFGLTGRTLTELAPVGPSDGRLRSTFSPNPKPPPLGGGVFTLPSRMTKASPLSGYLPAKLYMMGIPSVGGAAGRAVARRDEAHGERDDGQAIEIRI